MVYCSRAVPSERHAPLLGEFHFGSIPPPLIVLRVVIANIKGPRHQYTDLLHLDPSTVRREYTQVASALQEGKLGHQGNV